MKYKNLNIKSAKSEQQQTTTLREKQFFYSITLLKTQNVMETRLTKRYYFESPEFENDKEIISLALVFELLLWPGILLFSTKY